MPSLGIGNRMGNICSSKYLLSWRTDSNSAAVGDAEASPTPTPRSVLGFDDLEPVEYCALPCSTDLEESKPAIELEKAWRESYVMHCWPMILEPSGGIHYIDLVPTAVHQCRALNVSCWA